MKYMVVEEMMENVTLGGYAKIKHECRDFKRNSQRVSKESQS